MSIQSNVNNILQTQAKMIFAKELGSKYDYQPVNKKIKQMTDKRIKDIREFKTAQQLGIKKDDKYTNELMASATKTNELLRKASELNG